MACGPEQPGPGRSVAGRHVLGSSPESLEPVGRASLPSLAPAHEARDETRHTIHGVEWADARRRIPDLAPASRALFTTTLDHVEAGWEHVRELQRWWEDNREHTLARSGRLADLLHFVEADLVDTFRGLALGVALLVPGYPGWAGTADADGVEGDLDAFCRYFTVFTLAVEQEPQAEPVREAARAAVQGLAGWCTELGILVAGIAAVCEL